MAIRDDFTAGEVLAAADLNDTFAEKIPYAYGTATPTTTVDGYVWFDENSTPPEPKFWDGAAFQAVSAPGGLVHIATESFSAVSSVSVNNCFNATYNNYEVKIIATSSAGAQLSHRYRVSGVDASGSDYVMQELNTTSTTVTSRTATRDAQRNIFLTGTEKHAAGITIFDPFLASQTMVTIFGGGSGFNDFVTGRHTLSTSYDGITILPASGTITGTIRIYGYLNS
jgi:hypothetical protein